MKLIVLLELCFVGVALGGSASDSVTTPPTPKIPPAPNLELRVVSPPLPVLVEHDGVVIGNMKYSILIVRPDPRIDYRMLTPIPRNGIPQVPFHDPFRFQLPR